MILQWFDARQASETGAALADKLTPSAARIDNADAARTEASLQALVKQVGSEVHGLGLNFYQRAKLANAFKWRLIENGVEKNVAHEVTQFLVVDISSDPHWPTRSRTAGSFGKACGQSGRALRPSESACGRARV